MSAPAVGDNCHGKALAPRFRAKSDDFQVCEFYIISSEKYGAHHALGARRPIGLWFLVEGQQDAAILAQRAMRGGQPHTDRDEAILQRDLTQAVVIHSCCA